MVTKDQAAIAIVHCRIGSSEMFSGQLDGATHVHCRIGSSEMAVSSTSLRADVHCRIGSSENRVGRATNPQLRSLPHRQLRKTCRRCAGRASRSLPHRQLRNRRTPTRLLM